MGAAQIMERLTFVMYGDNLERVCVSSDAEGKAVVRIDLHGMTCKEAQKAIETIICINRFSFRFDIVHGYNHGTSIKSMIYNRLCNPRIIKKYGNAWNPGETFLEIA